MAEQQTKTAVELVKAAMAEQKIKTAVELVAAAMTEKQTKTAVELVAEPWIKRPKIKGNFAPAKRGLVKVLIFNSFASMFGSDSESESNNPFFPEPTNPTPFPPPMLGVAGGP